MPSWRSGVSTLLLLIGMAGVAGAQEPAVKAAPKRLVVTTAVEAARTAYDAALPDVLNIRWDRAAVPLKQALEADPNVGLIRAVYSAIAPGLSVADRGRELDRAVADAAHATTPELVAAAAWRELVRGNMATGSALAGAARAFLPDDPLLAWLQTGLTIWKGEPATAVTLARDYLARFPDDAPMYNLLGYAEQGAGRPAAALEAAKKYVALLPNHPNAYDTYGELLQQQGKLEEAAQQYHRRLELEPGSSFGYDRLADLEHIRRDPVAVKKYLDAKTPLLQTAADRVMNLALLAANAVFAGDIKAAKQYLAQSQQEAIKGGIAADEPRPDWRLALLTATQGDVDGSMKLMAAANATPGPRNTLYFAFGHGALGRLDDAHADLRQLEAQAADPQVGPDGPALGRVIEAALRGDVMAANRELSTIKAGNLRVVGNGFVLRAARKVGDATTIAGAQAAIDAYTPLDCYAAFTHALTQKK